MPYPLSLVSKLGHNLFGSDTVFCFSQKTSSLATLRPNHVTYCLKTNLKPVYTKLTNFKILVSVVWKLYAIKLSTELQRKNYPATFDNFLLCHMKGYPDNCTNGHNP